MNRLELYNELENKYGIENQIIVAIEELSELGKELCKLLRNKNNEEELIEELADVEIMLEQIIYYYKFRDRVDDIKIFKLNRTRNKYIGKDYADE